MKNSSKDALLVIDAQIDFHDVTGASLPVPGAVKDTERIVKFIENVNPFSIFSSMDTHYSLDIAHKAWFSDAKGDPIAIFSQVKPEDLQNGKWSANVDPVYTLKYLQDLEANGEFVHTIWPDHCLIGSPGHGLLPIYATALHEWMKKNMRWVNFITKGKNPYTEHFGIFRANVPVLGDSNTNVDQRIFKTMRDHDRVFLTGQARSHCVANSLRQILQIAPDMVSKLVVLEDTMSDVPGLPADFYVFMNKIYEDAKAAGVQFAKSTDI